MQVFAGCNHMSANYWFDGHTLHIDEVDITKIVGCDPARHQQDAWLFDILAREPVVAITGQTLTISLGATTITLLDREYATPDVPRSGNGGSLIGMKWVLVAILSAKSSSMVPDWFEPTFWFDATNHVYVDTGCRSGVSVYRVDGKRIWFGRLDLMATPRTCGDIDRTVETAIRHIFAADEVVFGVEGSMLRFVASPLGLEFRGLPENDGASGFVVSHASTPPRSIRRSSHQRGRRHQFCRWRFEPDLGDQIGQ
jgi:heat shock protein HslJ